MGCGIASAFRARTSGGVRTVSSSCQTGDAVNHPGFEDQIAENKHASLQNCIALTNPAISAQDITSFRNLTTFRN